MSDQFEKRLRELRDESLPVAPSEAGWAAIQRRLRAAEEQPRPAAARRRRWWLLLPLLLLATCGYWSFQRGTIQDRLVDEGATVPAVYVPVLSPAPGNAAAVEVSAVEVREQQAVTVSPSVPSEAPAPIPDSRNSPVLSSDVRIVKSNIAEPNTTTLNTAIAKEPGMVLLPAEGVSQRELDDVTTALPANSTAPALPPASDKLTREQPVFVIDSTNTDLPVDDTEIDVAVASPDLPDSPMENRSGLRLNWKKWRDKPESGGFSAYMTLGILRGQVLQQTSHEVLSNQNLRRGNSRTVTTPGGRTVSFNPVGTETRQVEGSTIVQYGLDYTPPAGSLSFGMVYTHFQVGDGLFNAGDNSPSDRVNLIRNNEEKYWLLGVRAGYTVPVLKERFWARGSVGLHGTLAYRSQQVEVFRYDGIGELFNLRSPFETSDAPYTTFISTGLSLGYTFRKNWSLAAETQRLFASDIGYQTYGLRATLIFPRSE